VQAKYICPREEPDGRSSVVAEEDPKGKLYCLNVYTSDLKEPDGMPPGSVKRLRVLEGVPLEAEQAEVGLPAAKPSGDAAAGTAGTRYPGSSPNGIPPLASRRILGEIPVQADGSFNIEIPANTPIELQLLDADGMALRSCGWIWAKNREPRGCIGCHEDGELVPENRFVDAAGDASIDLCLPPQQRRSVDFRRDVMPIIAGKCAKCHGREEGQLHLDGNREPVESPDWKAYFNRSYGNLLASAKPADEEGTFGKYVHPGRARTSPLIWHIFGRNTSRPWDGVALRKPVKQMPPTESEPLDEDEKRMFVEWIDMGAQWSGIPAAEEPLGKDQRP